MVRPHRCARFGLGAHWRLAAPAADLPFAMRLAPALALLLFAAPALRAQEQDPLKSPACAAALQRLEAARAARDAADRVEALRGDAARTCLGLGSPPSRPGRVTQPPTVVPPPAIEVPRAALPPSLPAPPPAPAPPVKVDRLPAPAQCDAGGCWVDDGSHRRYVPPSLVGPSGMPCIQQGGQVYCP